VHEKYLGDSYDLVKRFDAKASDLLRPFMRILGLCPLQFAVITLP
jgi:hypothetical protein